MFVYTDDTLGWAGIIGGRRGERKEGREREGKGRRGGKGRKREGKEGREGGEGGKLSFTPVYIYVSSTREEVKLTGQ